MPTCPNCGASYIGNVCPYCGNNENGHDDYSQALRGTRIKREIRELQIGIDKEQKEISKLLKDNSPNGCLKIGMVSIFRDGDGIGYVGLGAVISLLITYAICRFCDKSGNEDIQKKINSHHRNIKKLTKEIEDLQNGIG